jgi:thiamine transport system substrate-binding protein
LYNRHIKVSIEMSEIHYRGRRDPRKVIVALALIMSVSVAAYAIWVWPRPKLLVYTYDSFLKSGDLPDTIDDEVFGPFMRQYGVDVQIVRLQTDANGIVSRLVAESQRPVADVVIGIDNALILQPLAQEVTEPYVPSTLNAVNDSLVNALDPEHHVVPFDFGLVSIIYSQSKINETVHPELANLTFADLASHQLASVLVTESPLLSSPGLSFLLTQIAVYEKLLNQDWKTWWTQVKGYIDVQPGWTEAWTKWYSDPATQMMVSYGTDPAYSYHATNSTPDTKLAPIYHNGTRYAWMQVEGIGLVKNGPNPTLARAFIDYCLTPSVQSYVGLNQWMFPAANHISLDKAFDYALHPNEVAILNDVFTRTEIAANLTDWLTAWDIIMST